MTLKERYEKEIVPALQKDLELSNKYQVPQILKIVVNVGLGDGAQNAKLFDNGVEELQMITGQKPLITRAKQSIAGFKIRQGMPIGAKVTLRGDRMYDFLAKLTGIVLPRIRDFRGLNPNGFDGLGNYNLGLKDQLVFPEINYDKVQRMRGLNITIVTSARTDMEARALLEQFGFPFQKKSKSEAPKAQAS
ncbi:50S ribosomal protein L5 [Vampirovibrio chlorellavorus]|uniref:50S ribosomal protein L5 n=1 Tax=Vampirovibrio chlorellavorus TaxID=758823 RepID=UPI0026F18C65|nr:50S ribosomal protein L5 [Vampirovibrio chlorellavorus]